MVELRSEVRVQSSPGVMYSWSNNDANSANVVAQEAWK